MKGERQIPSWKAGYMVDTIQGQLNGLSAILVTYQGLKANVLNEFRGIIASEKVGGKCRVVQNTLIKKAAAQLGLTGLAEAEIHGDTALVTGPDPVALAKAIKEFAKGKEQMKVKMGFVENQLLDAQGVAALADLPSREVLLGQILGLLNAPASGIARALNAGVAQILYVLNAISAKKEEQQTT